jgi:putative nucleotidyltransferase with HDIG domain
MALKKSSARELALLLDEVEESEISSIRRIVSDVIVTLANPAASVQDLKDIIEIDPPLAAKVLRLANSAYYSRGRSYQTIEEAVIWLGFNTVLRMILSQKMCELFASGDAVNGYSRRGLWRHCTATALLARLIQRREFGVAGETAYVIGLLHDIGIIILDQFRHDAFVAALQRSAELRRPLDDSLQEIVGFGHVRIGTALANRWRWPEEIVTAIGGHHDPLSAPECHKREVLTLFVANRFCHSHDLGHGAPIEESDGATWAKTLQKLAIAELALEMLHADLKIEIDHLEAKGLM